MKPQEIPPPAQPPNPVPSTFMEEINSEKPPELIRTMSVQKIPAITAKEMEVITSGDLPPMMVNDFGNQIRYINNTGNLIALATIGQWPDLSRFPKALEARQKRLLPWLENFRAKPLILKQPEPPTREELEQFKRNIDHKLLGFLWESEEIYYKDHKRRGFACVYAMKDGLIAWAEPPEEPHLALWEERMQQLYKLLNEMREAAQPLKLTNEELYQIDSIVHPEAPWKLWECWIFPSEIYTCMQQPDWNSSTTLYRRKETAPDWSKEISPFEVLTCGTLPTNYKRYGATETTAYINNTLSNRTVWVASEGWTPYASNYDKNMLINHFLEIRKKVIEEINQMEELNKQPPEEETEEETYTSNQYYSVVRELDLASDEVDTARREIEDLNFKLLKAERELHGTKILNKLLGQLVEAKMEIDRLRK